MNACVPDPDRLSDIVLAGRFIMIALFIVGIMLVFSINQTTIRRNAEDPE